MVVLECPESSTEQQVQIMVDEYVRNREHVITKIVSCDVSNIEQELQVQENEKSNPGVANYIAGYKSRLKGSSTHKISKVQRDANIFK